MTKDTRYLIRLGPAVAFLLTYIALTGAMMYVYTEWLRLGDPKFGGGGWELYWPLWTVGFAPLALCAVIAAWSKLSTPSGCVLLLLFAAITFCAMPVSLFFDIDWWVLIIEWVVLGVIFFRIASAHRSA